MAIWQNDPPTIFNYIHFYVFFFNQNLVQILETLKCLQFYASLPLCWQTWAPYGPTAHVDGSDYFI